MKQTKKKKPRVFRTLIRCVHNNAKMTKNIDDERPDGKKQEAETATYSLFRRVKRPLT